jgi:quinol monooxygenase YgiN
VLVNLPAVPRPTRVVDVLVVNRFQVPEETAAQFRAEVEEARSALSEQRGFVRGSIGRNVDDPTLWTLVTEWENVGAYRRALSSYDVKLRAVALLGTAIEEPSAYEDVEPDTTLNEAGARSLG